MPIKIVAWDDKPEYFEKIATFLEKDGVFMEIFDRPDDFREAYAKTQWDAVILDVMGLGAEEGTEFPQGAVLAEEILKEENPPPIFMLSMHAKSFDADTLKLPRDRVVVHSKSQVPAWAAQYLRDQLRDRGILLNDKKVLLIHGDSPEELALAEILTGETAKDLRLDIRRVLPEDPDVLRDMRDATAFVAMLAPQSDRTMHPDVLVQCGMTRSLPRGLERLVLVRWMSGSGIEIPAPLRTASVIDHKPEAQNITVRDIERQLQKLGARVFS